MTDFDDFDWVDDPTGRKRGVDDPSGVDPSTRYSRRNDPVDPREMTGRAGAPERRYGAPSRTSAYPSRDSSRSSARRRVPRRTMGSRITGGIRGLVRNVGGLPKPLLITAGALIFVIALTIILDSAMFYGKVHAGVTVAGQGLGGKTYDESLGILGQRVDELSGQPITVVSDSGSWTVTPDDLGQVIDVEASIQTAMQATRKSNFVADLARRLRLYFNGDAYPFVGELDQEKFDEFVTRIAGELDVDPVNQSLSIQGDTVETVQGTSGIVVDQDSLRAQLMEALFAHSTAEIQVPMMTKAPDVMAASTDEAVAMVQTMLSDDLTLEYLAPRPEETTTTTLATGTETAAQESPQTTTTISQTTTTTVVETSAGKFTFISKTKTLSPAEIKELLDYRSEDRNGTQVLVPYISAEKLGPLFHRIEGPMTVPAVDAYFQSNDRGFTCQVVPGKVGKGLDHEATAAALTEAALRTDDRVADALVKDIDPDFTTEDAEAMGITQALGSFETVWDGVPERDWNVRLAAARVSNLYVEADPYAWSLTAYGNRLVAPGEEFDFAKILGPRTEQAGFKGSVGIQDGQLVDGVLGGGICQVSTTMFNAALQAGLQITERWNHSLFIEHYPEGSDATITGGGAPKNLKFVNDTPNYIWIYGWSDGVKTIFTLFGTSDGRRASLSVSERYDWRQRSASTVTVLDPKLEWTETSVAHPGQDAFKVTLTRTITWPDGREISEEWISEWGIKPKVVAFPTSTTAPVAPASPSTATTVPAQ